MAEALLNDLGVLRCIACGRHQLPPKVACHACGESALAEVRIGPEGSVLAFTVIRVPPADFMADAPYAVLIVGLAAGIKLAGRLKGPQSDVSVGTPVRLVRRDAIGYWFERAESNV